jgi:hypothetical protein
MEAMNTMEPPVLDLIIALPNGLGTDEGPGQVDFNETSGHLNVVTFSREVGASKEIKLDEEL